MGNDRKSKPGPLTRRAFGAVSAAAGLVSSFPTAAQQPDLVETDVEIEMPDGVCDAALIHPAEGRLPAVLVWTDARGLRPAFRTIGRTIAAAGYTVLVPNPFYRSARAPVIQTDEDPKDETVRGRLQSYREVLQQRGVAERDGAAYIAYLDTLPMVESAIGAGTVGYCMGGALTMRTAAVFPERIAAGASFHGGGLVTNRSGSPHRRVRWMRARYYFGIADDDDAENPQMRPELEKAFAQANLPVRIDVFYGNNHGWCVPDHDAYNEAGAQRAMTNLLALFEETLI